MALRQMPKKMRDGSWGQMAYDIRKAFGNDHKYVEEFRRLEDKFLAEFNRTRAEARRLLKAGRKDEAAKLLNDCFERQFAEADKLLTRIHNEAKTINNQTADAAN